MCSVRVGGGWVMEDEGAGKERGRSPRGEGKGEQGDRRRREKREVVPDTKEIHAKIVFYFILTML